MRHRRSTGALVFSRTFLSRSFALVASTFAISCAFHVHGTADTAGTTSSSSSGDPSTGGAASTSTTTGSTGGAGGTSSTGGMGGTGGTPPICGDGNIDIDETCDDKNETADDGCFKCSISPGYTCAGAPSVCTLIPPQVVTVTGLDVSITDKKDYYKGTLETMDCATITLVDQGFPEIQHVTLEVGIEHPYVGDLVLKLVSPMGTVSTMMSRPGLNEPTDKYNEDNGYSPHLAPDYPILFDDAETDDAEQMGSSNDGGKTVCKDDQRCKYHPNHGSGPGTGLADFNGQSPAGDWRVCLADGDNNDAGKLRSVKLTVLAWPKPPAPPSPDAGTSP
ncbi:Multiple EGF-like-domain protein 3 precursor [Minicystis rosea]|nr:Multiple EGF-like-domain protein 3 precursor [Minicystis rosea]